MYFELTLHLTKSKCVIFLTWDHHKDKLSIILVLPSLCWLTLFLKVRCVFSSSRAPTFTEYDRLLINNARLLSLVKLQCYIKSITNNHTLIVWEYNVIDQILSKTFNISQSNENYILPRRDTKCSVLVSLALGTSLGRFRENNTFQITKGKGKCRAGSDW